jgi:hypothetical protein
VDAVLNRYPGQPASRSTWVQAKRIPATRSKRAKNMVAGESLMSDRRSDLAEGAMPESWGVQAGILRCASDSHALLSACNGIANFGCLGEQAIGESSPMGLGQETAASSGSRDSVAGG